MARQPRPDSTDSLSARASPTLPWLSQTHVVQVGFGDHKFNPEVTQAGVGDVIEFQFYPTNHSVVRAEYKHPCIPYEMTGPNKEGFFSGFQYTDMVLDDPARYRIRINDTDPVFFYCSAPGSCINQGMVGAINPNSSMPFSVQQGLARNSTYMLNPGESFPAETPHPSSSTSFSAATLPPASAEPLGTSASTDASHSTSRNKMPAGVLACVIVAIVFMVTAAAFAVVCHGRHKIGKNKMLRNSNLNPSDIDPHSPRRTLRQGFPTLETMLVPRQPSTIYSRSTRQPSLSQSQTNLILCAPEQQRQSRSLPPVSLTIPTPTSNAHPILTNHTPPSPTSLYSPSSPTETLASPPIATAPYTSLHDIYRTSRGLFVLMPEDDFEHVLADVKLGPYSMQRISETQSTMPDGTREHGTATHGGFRSSLMSGAWLSSRGSHHEAAGRPSYYDAIRASASGTHVNRWQPAEMDAGPRGKEEDRASANGLCESRQRVGRERARKRPKERRKGARHARTVTREGEGEDEAPGVELTEFGQERDRGMV